MRVGYVVASHRVTVDGKAVGYLYREATEDEADSGWRVFAEDESEAYADDAENFSMYNAFTLVDMAPEIASVLAEAAPVAFERDRHGRFVRVSRT